MPYIGTRTTAIITKEKEITLKKKLGLAIELIPGKSEAWLMTEFTGGCNLWIRGDDSADTAFVEVKVYGRLERRSCDALTGKICEILGEELGIASDRIYVTYSEFSEWGWNGGNF